ncbi:MAG: AAA family ATPase [Bifidobacteriaceae bacterium]|jgi:energy-coupling factor transporter ATP-binding protein EcfA2|nr:AAA family ATPase [Bifidobacteriaceae bacterium]
MTQTSQPPAPAAGPPAAAPGSPFEASDRSQPLWLRSIHAALPATALFVVHGGIRDVHLTHGAGPGAPVETLGGIGQVLAANGFDALLVYDPLEGLRLMPLAQRITTAQIAQQFSAYLQADFGSIDCAGYANLDRICQFVTTAREPRSEQDARLALVVDYTSQAPGGQQPEGDLLRAMLASLKAAHQSHTTAHTMFHPGSRASSLKHPVFWLVDKPSDLPAWLLAGDAVRQIAIPVPDLDTRTRLATALVAAQPDIAEPKDLVDRLVAATEGLSLKGMREIVQLAWAGGGLARGVEEAARTYRMGVSENPWQGEALRERVLDGQAALERRVKGQPRAVSHALDVVIRSAMGLTSAHQAKPGGAPRGVMVFAGPTGVGKTELAKSIAELVFGDEQAMIRFDMSEFRQDGSDTRLIGAPPGYVGHGAGGELINAMKRRPFTVVLFDEMEKAHTRIFDKFLQILSDGRLTSGAGETVSFAEALIIFTSNVGAKDAAEAGLADAATPDEIAAYEQMVLAAIKHYFETELNRPELAGRIGDNIVVFRPMSHGIAQELAAKFIGTALDRARAGAARPIRISERARAQAMAAMTTPEHIAKGGRGIALALEPVLVNPLARTLFRTPGHGALEIAAIRQAADGSFEVVLADG